MKIWSLWAVEVGTIIILIGRCILWSTGAGFTSWAIFRSRIVLLSIVWRVYLFGLLFMRVLVSLPWRRYPKVRLLSLVIIPPFRKLLVRRHSWLIPITSEL